MKLSEFKNHLKNITEIDFVTPEGNTIPQHFHVTEVGLSTKHFIDCGGTVREEKLITFQLWVDNDLTHRLVPEKLLNIIAISEKFFSGDNLEIEAEYQTETIGRYGVGFNNGNFVLENKKTACLALDACGISPKVEHLDIKVSNSCTPGGGCC